MKNTVLTIIATTALFTTFNSFTQAQEASTVPYGVMKFTIPAGSIENPQMSALSVTLQPTVPDDFQGATSGVITGVTSDTITSSGAGWAASALADPVAPYFLKITSGPADGRLFLISANTANTVTLDTSGDNLTNLGIETDTHTFKIFPGFTLNSFFGSDVLTSSDINSADVVYLLINGTWTTFYHNGTSWKRPGARANFDNQILNPDSGILFLRKDSTDLEIVLDGFVPTNNTQLVVSTSGYTMLGGIYPVDRTLLDVGIQDLTSWIKNSSVNNADQIILYNGSAWETYYHDGTNWKRPGARGSSDDVIIPAGTPLLLSRIGSGDTEEFTNIIPYSTN